MIYAPSGCALGDCWASINWCLTKALECDVTVDLATYYKKGTKIKSAKDNLIEILPVFKDIKCGSLELVDEDPTPRLLAEGGGYLKWWDVYDEFYLPTKVTWQNADSKTVCCHFEGISKKHKNCSKVDQTKILDYLLQRGYSPIMLGREYDDLRQAVDLLVTCKYLVTVDSGYAHVAHSTRTPIHMIRNGRTIPEIIETHKRKPLTLYQDASEFINANK